MQKSAVKFMNAECGLDADFKLLGVYYPSLEVIYQLYTINYYFSYLQLKICTNQCCPSILCHAELKAVSLLSGTDRFGHVTMLEQSAAAHQHSEAIY